MLRHNVSMEDKIMNKASLKKFYTNRSTGVKGLIIPDNSDYLTYPLKRKYKHIQMLNSLTEYIDFECNFEDGKCKNHNSYALQFIQKADRIQISDMCCCRLCGKNVGYLNLIREDEIAEYAKYYNTKTGFWSNKGCKLPREKRSPVCTTHNCCENKKTREQLSALMDSAHNLFLECKQIIMGQEEKTSNDT